MKQLKHYPSKKAKAKERDRAMVLFAKYASKQGFSASEVREGLAHWFGTLHELPLHRQQDVINGSPYRDPPDIKEAQLIRRLVTIEQQMLAIARRQRTTLTLLIVFFCCVSVVLIGWLFQ